MFKEFLLKQSHIYMCHWDNVIATVHLANADLVLLSCRPSDKLNVLHL